MRSQFIFHELKRKLSSENYIEKENLLLLLNCNSENIFNLFLIEFIQDSNLKRNQVFLNILVENREKLKFFIYQSLERILNEKIIGEEDIFYRLLVIYENFSYTKINCTFQIFEKSPLSYALYFFLRKNYQFINEEGTYIELLTNHKYIFYRVILLIFNEEFLNEKYLIFLDQFSDTFESKQIIKIVFLYLKMYFRNNSTELSCTVEMVNRILAIQKGTSEFENNNNQIFISDNNRFETLLSHISDFRFMFLFSSTLKNISQTVICTDIFNFTCKLCGKFSLPFQYPREIYIENILWEKLGDYFLHHKGQVNINNLKKVFKLYLKPENIFYAKLFDQFSASLIYLFMRDNFKNFYGKRTAAELEKLFNLFPHLNLNTESYGIISEFTYEIYKGKIPNRLLIFIRNSEAESRYIELYLNDNIKNITEIGKNHLFFIVRNLSISLNVEIELLFKQYFAVFIAYLIENNIRLNTDLYQYIPSAIALLMRKREFKNLSTYKSYVENHIYEFFVYLLIYQLRKEVLRKFISKYEQTIKDNPIRFFFFLKNAYHPHLCFYNPLFFLISHVEFSKINFEVIKDTFHFIFKRDSSCTCINKEILDRKYITTYLIGKNAPGQQSYIFQLVFPYISAEERNQFNLPVEQVSNILLNSKTRETQQVALDILLISSPLPCSLELLYNFNRKFYREIIALMVDNSAVRRPVYSNSSICTSSTIDDGIRTIIRKLFSTEKEELSDVNYFIIQELSRKLKDYKTYPFNIFIDTEYQLDNIEVERKHIKSYSLGDLNRLYDELYYFVYNLMNEEQLTLFWNLGIFLRGEMKKIFFLMMCTVLMNYKFNEKLSAVLNNFIVIDCTDTECNCIIRAILYEQSSDAIFYGFNKFHSLKNISYELFHFLFEINRFCGMEIVNYRYLLIYALHLEQYYSAYWCINKIMDREEGHNAFTDFNLIFQHYFIFICQKIKLNIKLYIKSDIYFFKGRRRQYTEEFFQRQKIPNILRENTNYLYKYIYENLTNDIDYERTEALIHFLKDIKLKNKGRLDLVVERRKMVSQKYILKYHQYLTKDRKFTEDLQYEIFKYHLESGHIKRAKKIIKKMLKRGQTEAFYFKSFLFKNSKNHCLKILKQAKKYSNKNSPFFRKIIERIALMRNTEKSFKKAIKIIGANENLSFARAKYFQETDIKKSYYYFKETLFFGTAYIDIIIPTLLHIFCEKIRDESLQISDLLPIVGSEKLKQFLLQIIPKLNHENQYISLEIENLIIGLYENHTAYCTWKLMAFFNSTNREMKVKMTALKKKLNLDYHKKILKFISALRKIAEVKTKNPFKISDIIENTNQLQNIELLLNDAVVRVEYFEESVHVYKSLMAPKRISFVTKDGQQRSLILKKDDDLRRDQRMMELFNFINKHLPFGTIRTYGVLPIDSRFGFIEMVSNLCSMRELCNVNLQSFYKIYLEVKSEKIYGDRFEEVSSLIQPGMRNSFYKIFNKEKIFIQNSNNFIATYAVMCGVGWLIGLGDRHTENITVDMKSGDTVHVDINLIFGSSQLLAIPEKVPFRLTKNIIHAFGPMRLEIFRKYLANTLKIIHMEREMIESNLLSFIYDPLTYLNFTRNSDNKVVRRNNRINFYEILKQKFKDCDKKLADRLIAEATDKENLRKMFIGWCPHI